MLKCGEKILWTCTRTAIYIERGITVASVLARVLEFLILDSERLNAVFLEAGVYGVPFVSKLKRTVIYLYSTT